MRTLYFDGACGASGDMIVGALLDAGVDFTALRDGLMSLGMPGFTLSADKVNKRGITATQFLVHASHHHAHEHRHLDDIVEIIEESDLPPGVKTASTKTFQRIAKCEAAIHGTSVDEVHFHEVGAIDSIVDIVGAHLAMHYIKPEQVMASPLNLGSGTIKAAHGVMPVPAPATVALLEGVPCYGSDVVGELVTPTGAALVSQLATSYGPMPEMRVEKIGYGSGTRDLPDRANVLRVVIGETTAASASIDDPTEPVCVMECTIDDMNPELLPPLLAGLIAQGARDAFLTPVLGKKGRPAYLLTILCDEAKTRELLPAVFNGSTTLGVRMRTEQRVCLEREWRVARTPWGEVRIKVGRFRGQITCMAPEFEDCRRLAEERKVSILAVYEVAHAAAVRGEVEHA